MLFAVTVSSTYMLAWLALAASFVCKRHLPLSLCSVRMEVKKHDSVRQVLGPMGSKVGSCNFETFDPHNPVYHFQDTQVLMEF